MCGALPEMEDISCDVERYCNLYKSKAALTIHKRRMHEPPQVNFNCNNCNMNFTTESNLFYHLKSCRGEREVRPGVVYVGERYQRTTSRSPEEPTKLERGGRWTSRGDQRGSANPMLLLP